MSTPQHGVDGTISIKSANNKARNPNPVRRTPHTHTELMKTLLTMDLLRLDAGARVIMDLTGDTSPRWKGRIKILRREANAHPTTHIRVLLLGWFKTPVRMTQAYVLYKRHFQAVEGVKNRLEVGKIMVSLYRQFVAEMGRFGLTPITFNGYYYLIRYISKRSFVIRRCLKCKSGYLDSRDEIITECYCCRAITQSSCSRCGGPIPASRGGRLIHCESCRGERGVKPAKTPTKRELAKSRKNALMRGDGFKLIMGMMPAAHEEPASDQNQPGVERRYRL